LSGTMACRVCALRNLWRSITYNFVANGSDAKRNPDHALFAVSREDAQLKIN